VPGGGSAPVAMRPAQSSGPVRRKKNQLVSYHSRPYSPICATPGVKRQAGQQTHSRQLRPTKNIGPCREFPANSLLPSQSDLPKARAVGPVSPYQNFFCPPLAARPPRPAKFFFFSGFPPKLLENSFPTQIRVFGVIQGKMAVGAPGKGGRGGDKKKNGFLRRACFVFSAVRQKM